VLELAVLGLLKERPLHGYDIRKRLREQFGLLANLSFGSLYPALARLEAAGAVRALEASVLGDADETLLALTGSLGGERAALVARRATAKAAAAFGGRGTRARKVYTITPAGEALFEQLLDAPSANDEDARAFALRLVFARHLTPAARVRLLERRHIQLTDRLQRSNRAPLEAEPGDFYERAVARHTRETLANDLAFVEELLEAERTDLQVAPPAGGAGHRQAARTRRAAVPAPMSTTSVRMGRNTR
jgi:DNA-binding PadR family transcriptional regulator